MHSLISRACHSRIPRCAVFILVMLALSRFAFCDEIHDAAQKGDLARGKALLKDNPDLVFSKDNNGTTSLHLAVRAPRYFAGYEDYQEIVVLLLKNKADVTARDQSGSTPLHWAAFGGYKDVVALLLENKAEINTRDNKGETPLHVAALEGNKDVVVLLRQHGGHE